MDNTYNIKKIRNQFLKNYHNDDYDKAILSGERLISTYKSENMTSLPEYATDLFNLACVYDENGTTDKAIPLYQKSADYFSKRDNEAASLKLADVYNNLGIAYNNLHQIDTALAYFKKCYNLRHELLPHDNPDFVAACYNIGSAYKMLNRFSEAAHYYAKALNSRTHTDIYYADNLYNLGVCYIESKDYEIGADYMKKALDIYKSITGNPDEYITALSFYSAALYRIGRYSDALDSYYTLIDRIKEQYGASQPFYADALSRLSDCHARLGDTDKAIPLKQKALNLIKKCLGTSHIFYASCLSELADLYLQNRDYSKAATMYSEALDIRTKILGLDNDECVDYVQALANIYVLMQLYNKAEDLLNYAINNLPCTNKHYGELVLELVKLYMETQDGEGLNRAFLIYNKIHPEKSFDEMLDIAEDIDF
jgi:tetratricopeptide (TPR) repeat protein